MVASVNIVDLVLIAIPVVICAFLGVKGVLPVMRGRFAIVSAAVFVAAIAISMVLSFAAFGILTVMDDAVGAASTKSDSPLGGSSASIGSVVSLNGLLLPAARFLARSRFVRSILVAFLQPSLLSVAGIACCLMLIYLRDALVRVGGDISIYLEHFAMWNEGATKK